MNEKKTTYIRPDTSVIDVRIEQMICGSGKVKKQIDDFDLEDDLFFECF